MQAAWVLLAAAHSAEVVSASEISTCRPSFTARKGLSPARSSSLTFCQACVCCARFSVSGRSSISSPSYSALSCCTSKDSDAAKVSIYHLQQGGASDACVASWSSLQCSLCDPRGGTQPRPPVCAPVCEEFAAACGDAFFAADASSGALVPCREEKDAVCARLAEWGNTGQRACELAGFALVAGGSGAWCFDGRAPPRAPKAPQKSSGGAAAGRGARGAGGASRRGLAFRIRKFLRSTARLPSSRCSAAHLTPARCRRWACIRCGCWRGPKPTRSRSSRRTFQASEPCGTVRVSREAACWVVLTRGVAVLYMARRGERRRAEVAAEAADPARRAARAVAASERRQRAHAR